MHCFKKPSLLKLLHFTTYHGNTAAEWNIFVVEQNYVKAKIMLN